MAAEELTARSPEQAFATARSTWKTLAAGVSRLTTPDAVLNRIAAKAMLDGYFLTKRWNGRWIVFDSVCYRCQWDDSSTKWFYALDLMGDHRPRAGCWTRSSGGRGSGSRLERAPTRGVSRT